MIEVEAEGYYFACPECERELRVNRKYLGERVQCKFCSARFILDKSASSSQFHAFYSTCPHCSKEVRASKKYMGEMVACKYCNGRMHFVDRSR